VHLVQAAIVSGVVSALAWRGGALRPSGGVAAAGVGTAALAAAGWPGGLILLAFFLPSSAVSRLWPAPATLLDTKDDRRDGWQVLANGGVPAAVAVAIGPDAAPWVLAAGLAAAAADTWATAVGAHSPTPPRHLLRGEVVPSGTSGGVSLLGSAGAAVGAAFVALAAAPFLAWRGAAIVGVIGLGGMLLDSALGASVQGRFHCDQCGADSERMRHRCGRPTQYLGGFTWLTNDGVNALATAAATAAGWAAWALYCSP